MEPLNEVALARALIALEEVRERLVVVGGTAHRLYARHPLARETGQMPLTTEDVDLAAPGDLSSTRDQRLLQGLLAAGFDEVVRGAEEPTFLYTLRSDAQTYIQFVAHATGSGRKRSGERDRLMTFSGIRAEKLGHVDILLHAPWTVTMDVDPSGGPLSPRDRVAAAPSGAEGNTLDVHVANPPAYLAQKLLTLASRPFDKRGRDLLYVFDTLALFGDALDRLGSQARELVPGLTAKRARAARLAVERHCQPDATAIRQATRIARDLRRSTPPPDQLASAIRRNLPRVLPQLLDLPA